MTDQTPLRPTTVEYQAPNQAIIYANEDGVHFRFRHGIGPSFEMRDMEKVISIYQAAKKAWEDDQGAQPRPPSREQIQDMTYEHALGHAADVAVTAIREHLGGKHE